jgi:hypothetical protein
MGCRRWGYLRRRRWARRLVERHGLSQPDEGVVTVGAARRQQLAVGHRDLTGNIDIVARTHGGDVGGHGWSHLGQLQPELGQLGIRICHGYSFARFI